MPSRHASLLAVLLLFSGPAAGRLVAEPPGKQARPAEERHWAFRSPVRPTLPAVRHSAWVRNPIDAFILARLEKAGLQPAPPADRAALLRRVTFDLTGLPPTPEELDSFLRDDRADAYERVVDRLLASPHYGERWAQHWLDVVRYAESNGYELDAERPHAWRYRDWVVRALNEDRPYDRFLLEQLAGDQLARGQDPRAAADLLLATGFHRCGPIHLVGGNTDPEMNRQEVLTEMTTAVGAAFLGLTIHCARCHDHKFDPITQIDYYQLQAFFAPTQPKDIDLSTPEERAAREKEVKRLQAKIAPLKKQVEAIDAPCRARLMEQKKGRLEPAYREALATDPKQRTPEQKRLASQAQTLIKVTWDEIVAALPAAERERRAQLRAEMHALEAQLPPPVAHAWAVADEEKTPPTHVLKRGNIKNKGKLVTPDVPQVLMRLVSPPPRLGGAGSREGESARPDRIALARWLARPDHPLTARVMANRLWQHHFGRGLVGTPNDFGLHGDKPTHPELLDWLACEFQGEPGVSAPGRRWSLKHLHRLMVLSATYRQDSRPAANPKARRADPDNRLLGRMNRRRLEGESLRDATLATAGTLFRRFTGPMVRVPLEPEVYDLIFTEGEPDGLWPVTPDAREQGRRSLYLFVKRNIRLPLLEAFDRPDTLTPCAVRPVSTFAPQALILMNGPFLQAQSKAFAGRLLRECGDDAGRQIDRAYRLALARPPRPEEARQAREFLASQAQLLRKQGASAHLDPRRAALADFCLALLNRNEFLYVR